MRLVGLTFLVCGCGLGSGTGALDGALYIRSCTNDADYGTSLTSPAAYHMAPEFFAAAPVDDFNRQNPQNRISIRMQPSGNRVEEADVLNIMVANDYEVATQLNQPLAVGPATNVRGSLNLNSRCPKAEVEMELDGTITFTHFGKASADAGIDNDFSIDFDDRLNASFDFEVVDRRAATLGGLGGVSPDAAASGHLTGFFDFIVRQGRAAQSP